MKIEIKGKHQLEEIRQKKLSDGVYLIQIIFNTPKQFECSTGDYSMTIFATELIEVEFIPETKDEENLRFICNGSRYIVDVIAINRSFFTSLFYTEHKQSNLENLKETSDTLMTRFDGLKGLKRKNSLLELARIFKSYESQCVKLSEEEEK